VTELTRLGFEASPFDPCLLCLGNQPTVTGLAALPEFSEFM